MTTAPEGYLSLLHGYGFSCQLYKLYIYAVSGLDQVTSPCVADKWAKLITQLRELRFEPWPASLVWNARQLFLGDEKD